MSALSKSARPNFQCYVVGILSNDDGSSIVVIRKNRPKWQAGKLNGPGGKIEPGEMPVEAMVREFRQETGVETSAADWTPYLEMSGDDFSIQCYKARNTEYWAKAKTMETEEILKLSPRELHDHDCISNLRWMVEMALDQNYGGSFYSTVRY